MRSLRYLNTILTVLAVLLALQLWTVWTGWTPMGLALDAGPGATAAQAAPNQGGGIPDAGAQRKEMIDLLKRQVQQTDVLIGMLKSGEVRVRINDTPGKGK